MIKSMSTTTYAHVQCAHKDANIDHSQGAKELKNVMSLPMKMKKKNKKKCRAEQDEVDMDSRNTFDDDDDDNNDDDHSSGKYNVINAR